MADRIRIPRYRTLIPNSTYGRDAELFRHPITEEKLQATQILQLSRYAVPSEDEVISLIQSTAREFNPLSTAEENQSVREIPLNEFMKMFPSEEVKMIQDGAKDSLSHLRNHCHTGDHQTGRAYLQAANGIIPNEILDETKSKTDLLKKEILEKAEAEAIKIKEKAKKEIESEKYQLYKEIKQNIIKTSVLILNKTLGDILDESIKTKYTDLIIKNLPKNNKNYEN